MTRLSIPLDAVPEDAYAVPQCMASVRGDWRWEDPHQCPWRGRWGYGSARLCGHHIKLRSVELHVPIPRLTPIGRRRAIDATQMSETDVVRFLSRQR